jgi:hypothetical protein
VPAGSRKPRNRDQRLTSTPAARGSPTILPTGHTLPSSTPQRSPPATALRSTGGIEHHPCWSWRSGAVPECRSHRGRAAWSPGGCSGVTCAMTALVVAQASSGRSTRLLRGSDRSPVCLKPLVLVLLVLIVVFGRLVSTVTASRVVSGCAWLGRASRGRSADAGGWRTLDVLEHGGLQHEQRWPAAAVDELPFQGREFGNGVVVCVPARADRDRGLSLVRGPAAPRDTYCQETKKTTFEATDAPIDGRLAALSFAIALGYGGLARLVGACRRWRKRRADD